MNSRIRFTGMAFAALLFTLLTPAALRADSINLVANGNFETGTTADWTLTKAAHGSDTRVDKKQGHDGANAVSFEAMNSKYDVLAQTLSTTKGEAYTLTFWLYDRKGDGANSDTDFQVLWDGASLLDQYTTTTSWTEYTYTAIGTGSDTLTFEGYNHPSLYYLSDVSVTANVTSVTPEPSSFLLLGTGLAGFAGMLKHRLAVGGRA